MEDAEEAFEGAEVAMSGVNSFGVRWAGERLATLLKPGMHVLSITKGMEAGENGDLRILPEVLAEYRVGRNTRSSRKLRAARKTWGILRQEPGLSLPGAVLGFLLYAVRAVRRRL